MKTHPRLVLLLAVCMMPTLTWAKAASPSIDYGKAINTLNTKITQEYQQQQTTHQDTQRNKAHIIRLEQQTSMNKKKIVGLSQSIKKLKTQTPTNLQILGIYGVTGHEHVEMLINGLTKSFQSPAFISPGINLVSVTPASVTLSIDGKTKVLSIGNRLIHQV